MNAQVPFKVHLVSPQRLITKDPRACLTLARTLEFVRTCRLSKPRSSVGSAASMPGRQHKPLEPKEGSQGNPKRPTRDYQGLVRKSALALGTKLGPPI